jgi:glycerophosphoryl diester phosphodiesterase
VSVSPLLSLDVTEDHHSPVAQSARALTNSSTGDSNAPKCLAPPLVVPASAWPLHSTQIVIAHRGASAHLPEHTLAAYRLAIDLGADYIEPDLVPTKDSHLVVVHSVDLNVTTDVAQKFPNRLTHSQFMNRTGYWAYEFTVEEIQTLRVRQRLPQARPTTFDGLFGIPTLTDVLILTKEWQEDVAPLRFNSTRRRAGPGIYAELKDAAWVLEDTGLNMVDLLYQHISENLSLWDAAILNRLCNTKAIKEHEYLLPPLFIQSFEEDVLREFHDRWKDEMSQISDDSTSTFATTVVPPTVLLMSREKCHDENLWFELGESFRGSINGVGPDKLCLSTLSVGREFMERAEKLRLVVHPWTIRPELEFVVQQPDRIGGEWEELLYFFCEIRVDGIFSESVSLATKAATIDCSTIRDSPSVHHGCNSLDASCSPNLSPPRKFGTLSALALSVTGITLFVGLAIWRAKKPSNYSPAVLEPGADVDGDEGLDCDDLEVRTLD